MASSWSLNLSLPIQEKADNAELRLRNNSARQKHGHSATRIANRPASGSLTQAADAVTLPISVTFSGFL
jgi:hypothetical protein